MKSQPYEPVIDSASNFEYLPELIAKEGYVKELDCVIYRFPLSIQLPEIYDKIYQRVTSKKDLQFKEFTSRKQLKPLIIPVLRMVNESFKDIYGFVPMDKSIEKMIDKQAHKVARDLVMRTSQNMKLEDQATSQAQVRRSIEQKALEIKMKMPKQLWD